MANYYIKNWFSNMAPCIITINGINYPSVENAYQAAKTYSLEDRQRIAKLYPNASKKAGRSLKLREDWEWVKLGVMYVLLDAKFSQPKWEAELQATGCEYLVEWNNWGDHVWGIPCNIAANGFAVPSGQFGSNYLGRLLMLIRSNIVDFDTNFSIDYTGELRRLTDTLHDLMPPVPKELKTSTTHYETQTMPCDRMSVKVYGSEITRITSEITTHLDNIIALGGQIHLCKSSALTTVVKEYLDSKCYSRITWHDDVPTNTKYGLLVKSAHDGESYEYCPSNTRIVRV